MADLTQATSLSDNVTTNLLPESTGTAVSGPSVFTQGNTRVITGVRNKINSRAAALVGFPEADLQKQTGRYHFVEEFSWTPTPREGDILFELDTAALLKKAFTFTYNSQFYRNVKANPVLRLTISGNTAHVGMCVLIFQPSGIPENGVNHLQPGPYNHVFFYPMKNSAVELSGNYVKHVRYDDTTSQALDFGKFRAIVVNPLVVPDSTPQNVTIEVNVRFENISFKVYKSAASDVSFDKTVDTLRVLRQMKGDDVFRVLKSLDRDQLFRALEHKDGKEVDQQKGFLEAITDVADTVGRVAEAATSLLPFGDMLFHAPHEQTDNEWCVVDRPKPSERMQYVDDSDCVPDLTVTQLPYAMNLANTNTVFSWKWKHSTIKWTDTDAPGKVLFRGKMDYFDAPGVLDTYNDYKGSFLRATLNIEIQVIKNAFHKGQLIVQMIMGDDDKTTPQERDTVSQTFDISNSDTMKFDVPWPFHTDFITPGYPHCFYIQIGVACQLQSVNTTSSVEVNIWRSLGSDQQRIGGINQGRVQVDNVKIKPYVPAEEVGVHKGDSDMQSGISGEPTEAVLSSDVFQQEEAAEASVPHTTLVELEEQDTTEAEKTAPLYETKADDSQAWTTRNESSLKLSTHRPRGFVFKSNPGTYEIDTPITLEPSLNDHLVFRSTQADLLRMIPESFLYGFVSGGIRLKIVFGTDNSMAGTFLCFLENPSMYIRHNIVDHKEYDLSVPFVQKYPAIPVRADTMSDITSHETARTVSIFVSTDANTKWKDAKMYIYLSAEDDYTPQQPMPFSLTQFIPLTLTQPLYYGTEIIPGDQERVVEKVEVGVQKGDVEQDFRPWREAPKDEDETMLPEIGNLGNCGSRKFYDALSFDDKEYPKLMSVKNLHSEIISVGGSEYFHVHSKFCCILHKVNAPYSEVKEKLKLMVPYLDSKAMFDAYTPIPNEKGTFKGGDIKPRVIRHAGHYKAIIKYRGKLYYTVMPKYQNPHNVWGGIDVQKGNDSPVDPFRETKKKESGGWLHGIIHNKVMESVQTGIIEALGNFYKTPDCKRVMEAFALKGAAYVTHLISLENVTGMVSFVLHVLGDLHIAVDLGDTFKKVLSFMSENCYKFLSIFKFDDVDRRKGDDDEPFKDRYIARAVEFFKSAAGEIFSYIPTYQTVRNFCFELNIIGRAFQGAGFIFDAMKKFFAWLDITGARKKEALIDLKKMSESTSFTTNVETMKHMVVQETPATIFEIDKVQNLRSFALEFERRAQGFRDSTITELSTLMKQFLKWSDMLSKDRRGETEFEPVFILIEGKPGTGKSILSRSIAQSISKALGRAPDDYYSADLSAAHWTNYSDQPVIVVDDIGQDPKGEGIAKLIPLISCVPTPLPQAELSEKSCISSVRIVIATSNLKTPKDTWVTSIQAYQRRITLGITDARSKDRWDAYRYFPKEHCNDMQQSYVNSDLTSEDVVKLIWQKYKEKWDRHEEIKSTPLVALETDGKYEAKRREVTPVAMYDKSAVRRTFEYQPADLLKHQIDFTDVDKICLACVLDAAPDFDAKTVFEKPEWDKNDVVRLARVFGIPYLEPDTSIESVIKTRKTLIGQSKNRIAVAYRLYVKRGFKKAHVDDLIPTMNVWARRLQPLIDGVVNWGKRLAVVTGVLGAIYGGYKIVEMCRSDEQKGRYESSSILKRFTRATSEVPIQAQKGAVVTSKNLEEKTTTLKKYLGRWSYLRNDGSRYCVTALMLGQGFLLVPKHAIKVGMNHYFYDPRIQVEYSIPVSYETMATNAEHQEALDYAVVWTGLSVPLSKDLRGYFASNHVVSSIPRGAARMVLSVKGGKPTAMDTEQEYRGAIPVQTESGIIRVEGFSVPVKVEHGSCGSVLFTTEPGSDNRIIGILTSGTTKASTFSPVSREILDDLCGRIKIVQELPEIRVKKGTADDVELVGEQLGAGMGLVHTKVDLPEKVPGKTNLNTSYVATGVSKFDVNMVVNQNEDRVPSCKAMKNIDNTLTVTRGSRKMPVPSTAHLMEVKKITSDPVDDEFAVYGMQKKLGEVIPCCKLLTDDDILNPRNKRNLAGGLVEGNPMPRNTALGYTSKEAGFTGTKGDQMEMVTKTTEFKGTFSTREVWAWKPEYKEYLNKVEQDIKEGNYNRVISVFLKDELRPMTKIRQGKIRLIYLEDTALVYLMSKYFGDFMDHYRSLTISEGWHTLAKDPVAIWNKLGEWITWSDSVEVEVTYGAVAKRPHGFSYDVHKEKFKTRTVEEVKAMEKQVLAGDGKSWDQSVSGYLLNAVEKVIDPFYDRNEQISTEEKMANKEMRIKLLDLVALALTTYADSFYLSHGMKSGIFCTTEFNSLMQTVIILSGVIHHNRSRKGTTIHEDIDDALAHRFCTNGDDNLHAEPSPIMELSKEGYAKLMKETYANHGITLTGSEKDKDAEFQDLDGTEYLRRTFHRPFGIWCPLINGGTIAGLMLYRRKSTTPKENFKEAMAFAHAGRDLECFEGIRTLFECEFDEKAPDFYEVSTWYPPSEDSFRENLPMINYHKYTGYPQYVPMDIDRYLLFRNYQTQEQQMTAILLGLTGHGILGKSGGYAYSKLTVNALADFTGAKTGLALLYICAEWYLQGLSPDLDDIKAIGDLIEHAEVLAAIETICRVYYPGEGYDLIQDVSKMLQGRTIGKCEQIILYQFENDGMMDEKDVPVAHHSYFELTEDWNEIMIGDLEKFDYYKGVDRSMDAYTTGYVMRHIHHPHAFWDIDEDEPEAPTDTDLYFPLTVNWAKWRQEGPDLQRSRFFIYGASVEIWWD